MPRKPAEHRLSPAARGDLESIWRYTADTWGVDQAHHYTDALFRAFDELARRPELGSPCDHIRQGYRRRRVGEHMIYFRVTGYGVAVIRILHARMDAARHL